MPLTERDWKHLRRLQPIALDRFCTRVLGECQRVLTRHDATAHERYLELFRLLGTRDDELSRAFDDMRRSRAMDRLIAMKRLALLTDQEMERHSNGSTPSRRVWSGILATGIRTRTASST